MKTERSTPETTPRSAPESSPRNPVPLAFYLMMGTLLIAALYLILMPFLI